jgi:hypothetical protein
MRSALFALPAIAIGLITVLPSPLNLVGFVVLAGWGVFELAMLRRRWWRRGFQPTAEIAAGVVSLDSEGTLQQVLDALKKGGVRWVRVGRTMPTTVRAGTVIEGSRDGHEIELVLHPTSAATTELKVFGRSTPESEGIGSDHAAPIVRTLCRELGLQTS